MVASLWALISDHERLSGHLPNKEAVWRQAGPGSVFLIYRHNCLQVTHKSRTVGLGSAHLTNIM